MRGFLGNDYLVGGEMSDSMQPREFKGPPASEYLADFRNRYLPIIDRVAHEPGEDPYMCDYFERELMRLIKVYIEEATKPLLKTITDAMMRATHPMMVFNRETGDPVPERELWRGQHHGVWYRVFMTGYGPELQMSHNASLGEAEETWTVIAR